MTYIVTLLQKEQDKTYEAFWDQLSMRDECVLAYYHPKYRDVIQASLGRDASPCYWAVLEHEQEAEKIVAILPCFVRHSEVGPSYCSLPFFGPNAGVLCDFSHPDAGLWHKMLIGTALAQAKEDHAWSIVFYTPLGLDHFEWYEEALGGNFLVVDKFTQQMNLSIPFHWPYKRLRNIQRARKAGLRIMENPTREQTNQFWSLYMQNCAEYDIPMKPRICLDTILSEMWPKNLAQFLVAVDPEDGDRVVAGLLNLVSKRTVSYYIPVNDSTQRTNQPMALLIDRAAHLAASRGLTLWNWESSPSRDSGVYHYKERWGSIESFYRIYVKPLRPLEEFIHLGMKNIVSFFPFFFVYPFTQLERKGE